MSEDTIKSYKEKIALLETEVCLQNERFEDMKKLLLLEREIKIQLIHDISKLREERKEIIRLAESVIYAVRLNSQKINSDEYRPIFDTMLDFENFIDNPLY